MTEEQLIQEYSDAVYPKIAKALIGETKAMFIEKACDWLEAHSIDYVGYDGITDFRTLYHDFREAMTIE